jgi:hypothetical protein
MPVFNGAFTFGYALCAKAVSGAANTTPARITGPMPQLKRTNITLLPPSQHNNRQNSNERGAGSTTWYIDVWREYYRHSLLKRLFSILVISSLPMFYLPGASPNSARRRGMSRMSGAA